MVEDTAIEYFMARYKEIFGDRKKLTKWRSITILCSIATESSHLGTPEAEEVYLVCRDYVNKMRW